MEPPFQHRRVRSSSSSSASSFSSASSCVSLTSDSSMITAYSPPLQPAVMSSKTSTSSTSTSPPPNVVTNMCPPPPPMKTTPNNNNNSSNSSSSNNPNVSRRPLTRSRRASLSEMANESNSGNNNVLRGSRFNNKTLRRSTGLLNLDEASHGSPLTTKAEGTVTTPPTRAPSPFGITDGNSQKDKPPLKRPRPSGSTESTPSKFAFPKPKPVKQVLQQHFDQPSNDSPSFNNMIPNATQAAKMRKMSSMDNLLAQQNDNTQTPEFTNPFATSPSPSPTSSMKLKTHRQSLQPHAISKPKIKLSTALSAELNSQQYSTPDNNYKSVKPLQTAFMSTGLLSKKNRMKLGTKGPPDTPCKKPVASGASTPAPSTPVQSHNSHFTNKHQPFQSSSLFNYTSASPDGDWGSQRCNSGKLGLRDSKLRFSMDLSNDGDDVMFDDYDEPATPTKDQQQQQQQQQEQQEQQVFMPPPPPPQQAKPQQAGRKWDDLHQSDVVMKDDEFVMHPPPPPPARRRSSLNIEEPRTPAKTPKHTTEDEEYPLIKNKNVDDCLSERFDSVQLIGRGEFSMVYAVSQSVHGMVEPNRFAVKRTKDPFLGPKARNRRLEEVEILRQLTQNSRQDEGQEYVISLFDAWEDSGHLYIQTDYCENGNLEAFISSHGSISRLDEWRVWKIMVELAMGLNYIHNEGFLHLDLKPANVFITFEGNLKIGDFGMATTYPAVNGIEREGDREYIAPEVLSCQRYGKQADVFSFGITSLEIAANIVLPDNGLPWQKLRSGDLTEAGRLSSGDLRAHQEDELDDPDRYSTSPKTSAILGRHQDSSSVNGAMSKMPAWAPKFMTDNTGALDKIVQWMLNPDPTKRPTAHDLLMTPEFEFVETHRKAGAVIYEGDYGPEPDATDERQDEEMQL